MIRLVATVLLAVTLIGCGPREVRYERYPIPVYQVPAPPPISRPELPIHSLSASDMQDTAKVIRAYVVSVRLLLNYAEAHEAIYATYERLSRRASELTDTSPVRALAASPNERSARDDAITTDQQIMILANNLRILEDTEDSFARITEQYHRNEESIRRQFNEIPNE